jgi:hypothetical protein
MLGLQDLFVAGIGCEIAGAWLLSRGRLEGLLIDVREAGI